MQKKPQKKDYVSNQQKWQDKQFNPGHFTGGNIPVWLHKTGNRRNLGLSFLFFGLIYTTMTIYSIYQLIKNPTLQDIFGTILISIAAIIFTFAGITLFKKTKKQ